MFSPTVSSFSRFDSLLLLLLLLLLRLAEFRCGAGRLSERHAVWPHPGYWHFPLNNPHREVRQEGSAADIRDLHLPLNARLKKPLSEGQGEHSRRVRESTLGGSGRALSESHREFFGRVIESSLQEYRAKITTLFQSVSISATSSLTRINI